MVEMEERKWENLQADCLANVLGRAGLDSLLCDIPFVCKSWYKSSLEPVCWETIVFPREYNDGDMHRRLMKQFRIKEFSLDALIKFIVDRSHGKCSVLNLHHLYYINEETINYVVDKCPSLRSLSLPLYSAGKSFNPELIRKLKHLEELALWKCDNLIDLTAEININCVNFAALTISPGKVSIKKEQALAIVTNLSKIKYLNLSMGFIRRKSLVLILKGCKNLVHLDVRNCLGFNPDDKIRALASHIGTFNCEGSVSNVKLSSDYWAFSRKRKVVKEKEQGSISLFETTLNEMGSMSLFDTMMNEMETRIVWGMQ